MKAPVSFKEGTSEQEGEYAAAEAVNQDANGIEKTKNDPNLTPPQRAQTIATYQKDMDHQEESFPQSPIVKNSVARAAFQLGDYQKGIDRAETAVALAREQNNPQALAPALITSALGYGHEGDYPKAYAAAKEALQLNREGPYAQAARDIISLSKGRPPRGEPGVEGKPIDLAEEKKLNALLAQTSPLNDPRVKAAGERAAGHLQALQLLNESMGQLKVGDPQGAMSTLDRALKLDPANPDIFMQRATAFMSLNKISSALDEASKAIKLWTANGRGGNSLVAAYNMRSMLLTDGKSYEAALKDAQEALRLNPRNASAYFNRARALSGAGARSDEILADFSKAAQLDPQRFAADYEEALARYKTGQESSKPAPGKPGGFFAALLAAVAALVVAGAGLAVWRKKGESPVHAVPAPTIPNDDMLGGHLRLGRVLGSGGMGKVYEAWDVNLERKVAVKKLNENLEGNQRELERLLSEAKTVAALKHPSIVNVHEAFSERGDVFIVFEYVEGETLYERVSQKGRIKPAECLDMIKPVCEALDHAHGRGVIHRDLKPANIMIEDGRVKVMDFGIARRTQSPDRRTRTAMLVGTPAYMSPELQFGDVSRESDLYALAVCVYEMLTGRLPFDGPDLEADKQERRYPPASTYLSNAAGLDEFFKRALDPRRENRFHSGAEFWSGLSSALA